MFVPLLSLLACEPSPEQGPVLGDDTGPAPVVAHEVWAVSGGAGDLAWDGTGLLATAELGDSVLRWDPETDLEEELGSRLGGSPTSVVLGEDGTIYVSLTDSGVEGAVGVLEGIHDFRALATEASGALFRRPVDLAWDLGGDLVAVDSGAEAVWTVPVLGEPAEARWTEVSARAATLHEGVLILAGEDEVFEAIDGNLEVLNDLSVRDLVSWEGVLLGTTQEGVIRISDGSLLVGLDAGRPAAMALAGETLYVADESGGRIWAADLGSTGD